MTLRLSDIITVFRKGGQVKDPATWKNRTATTETLFSILVVAVGLARFLGVELLVDDEILMLIATGIAALLTAASAVITLITSRKVGLPGLAPVEYKWGAAPDYIEKVQARVKEQTMGHDY